MGIFDRFRKSKKEETQPAKTVEELKLEKSAESGLKKPSVIVAPTPKQPQQEQREQQAGEAKKTSKIQKSITYGDAYRMLVRPHLTEKATHLQHRHQIVFEVPVNANKAEVKKAIQSVFGLRPKKVQMQTLPRRNVWFGRTQGQTPLRKKAIAIFGKDQKLDIFSGV